MCEHIEKLKAHGYVDDSIIYLQKIEVNTDFPEIYRIAHYCLYCGLEIKDHVPNFHVNCSEYGNAHLKDHFGPHIHGNTYRFNLVTIYDNSTFRSDDPNYPIPTTIRFCPYCGEQQNI